jgi:hypothetical protein
MSLRVVAPFAYCFAARGNRRARPSGGDSGRARRYEPECPPDMGNAPSAITVVAPFGALVPGWAFLGCSDSSRHHYAGLSGRGSRRTGDSAKHAPNGEAGGAAIRTRKARQARPSFVGREGRAVAVVRYNLNGPCCAVRVVRRFSTHPWGTKCLSARVRAEPGKRRRGLSHRPPTVRGAWDYEAVCTSCGVSWWFSDDLEPDELDTVECLNCGATTQDIRSRGRRHFTP